MRIDAERLYFRSLGEADCTPQYLAWLQDPDVNQFLETRHHEWTIDAIKEFVARINACSNDHLFGIFLKHNNRHIGNIKIGPVNLHHGLAEVGMLIGARDCWGKGYATEALSAISRYAFQELGVRKIDGGLYVPNHANRRVCEKVGFRKEGHRRNHYILKGEPCDIVEYGLLPSDLNTKQPS
jgi:RimJ/RimL family protein N-acetyltransferase